MDEYESLEEDLCGLQLTTSTCILIKDTKNLIGISIGGGAPTCACLYIVQIFDNSPAQRDGSLSAGDELVAINRQLVKGKTKMQVAKLIQQIPQEEQVMITFNKLHVNEGKQGKTLDLMLKKLKHRLVEKMSTETADALGLSRAILCNDSIVKKLKELEKCEEFYKGLIEHIKSLLKGIFDLALIHKQFGDLFSQIGSREQQIKASDAFTQFGLTHRHINKYALTLMNTLKPMINSLNTFITKAIPDTKSTICKYADCKFEYLSYCLKVKELDDEEQSYLTMDEPLYRVETGNYEYRLVLKCRQMARVKFAKMRQDVLVKMELLDSKNVHDVVSQLQLFANSMSKYHLDCNQTLKSIKHLFPIEVDLPIELIERNNKSENNFNENYTNEEQMLNIKRPYSDNIELNNNKQDQQQQQKCEYDKKNRDYLFDQECDSALLDDF